jgi:hypothetical protein
MPTALTIDPPPICDDPHCLDCRTRVLYAVASALEQRGPTPTVSTHEGAAFTLAHVFADVVVTSGVSDKEAVELLNAALRRVHGMNEGSDFRPGVPNNQIH